ncbi:radical SAM family heme chaperone HemW [Balneolales bacterium ANBcel1]|nr:radical SAM family heme chaperone HemW [Balneolales bacterium ANBcel1]
MSGIYIHIPFCRQACSYCDFYFVTREQLIPAFVDALVFEISSVGRNPDIPESILGKPLQTLYFGGGTPSRLDASQFDRIVETLHHRFDLSQLREFTVEVNPEDVNAGWLSHLKMLGVTRLSMGVQSFQPELLHFMHRAHNAPQAHRALELVAAAGFETFSVDLIYGSPGQSVHQLEEDLDVLLGYKPPHISAYSLTLEPKTRLGKQLELGRLIPADDDDVAIQARLIRRTLRSRGIEPYEVSNYAVPGHEAVHNTAYWRHVDYLGLGPAAHSFFRDPDGKTATRRHNPPDLHAYSQKWARSQSAAAQSPASGESNTWHEPERHSPDSNQTNIPPAQPGGQPADRDPTGRKPDSTVENLSPETLAEERVMMGLRMAEGISVDVLKSNYGYELTDNQLEIIKQFRNEGLIAPGNPLRLTENGTMLADYITVKVLQVR